MGKRSQLAQTSLVPLFVPVSALVTELLEFFYVPRAGSASPALPAGKSKPEVGKGDKGKGKAQNENPPPGASNSFTEAQDKAIARWVESKKLLYDMKDKHKALRRQLWEGKAAEYGDKLALAETGELAGSDDSTMAGSLADKPIKEPIKKYTGYPTPRPPSRTTAAED
ncbi:hypothetical protein NHX12_026054 [Muraenolepis orangiensis]|uniref:Uncharacterized protein n=1 Tax=Muraenolepis orangiensis TaxID=630683 RepID=A0A9Q0EHX0_9TELE|nr:hypothetical protein NHX12_026054 [Muraenolepis orangiensis]